jgi:hypothetical protein
MAECAHQRWHLFGWPIGLAGLFAAGWASTSAATWLRFGRDCQPTTEEADALLDRLMPSYDIAERHHIRVAAPPALTLQAAREIDMRRSRIIRGIFAMRGWVLHSAPDEVSRPSGLVALTTSLGWRLIAEDPGHELVYGAVTQPWKANVVFRGLSSEQFTQFREPGYVKIAWTLRVDPVSASECIFRTETRVVTTDAESRRLFRGYWARFSPGILLIRRIMLRLLRDQAEKIPQGFLAQ